MGWVQPKDGDIGGNELTSRMNEYKQYVFVLLYCKLCGSKNVYGLNVVRIFTAHPRFVVLLRELKPNTEF